MKCLLDQHTCIFVGSFLNKIKKYFELEKFLDTI